MRQSTVTNAYCKHNSDKKNIFLPMPLIRLFLVVMVLYNMNTAQAADILLPKEISAFSFPTAELLMPCPGGTGVIGGHAFQDFNYNGLDDQIGKRIKGIEVNLFSCGLSGESELVATTVTDENGDYFFDNLVDGQEYRIEFSAPADLFYLQSGFSATQSKTTVQFITSPNCDISIGLANPDDYCEEDPKLVVPCYINGDPGALDAGGEDALVCFNTSFEGTRPTPNYLASAKEIGSTWGLTYNKVKKEIYTSAFLKRHVGLGSLGLGGIYKVDINGTSSVVSPFFDLNDLGANIGTYPTNGARGLSADINLPSNDAMAFDDVGKKGMGGLTMSTDGNTLYVVGLSDKMLHEIDISSGTPTAANLQSYTIPNPGCSGGEFRPFGIQIYNEQLYVGGVCDAEASGLKSDLKAVIYRLDGTTFTEVLDFSLDFQKGLASRSCDDDRGWFPWRSDVPESCFVSGNANIIVHPTPILSDIEFDANGDMVIGFMDRIGNQLGYLNYGPTGQTELYSAFTGGDIMKATPNTDGTYTIENNGTAGPNTTVGANNGEGIGGGEFFSFDVFEIAPNIPRPHSETAQGGVALIKGTNQVIGTALDPFGTFVNSGGVNYWDLSTGEVRDPGYVLFRSGSNSISTFSKANGLGDVATLCSLAPIELGGRIWVDANTNGVQDPCEITLSDISVTLYTIDGTEVETTVSDASGDYYFSDEVIRPNEEYFVVFGSAAQTQTPLALLDIYTPTAKNIGMSPNNSLNDSDVQVGDILGITNALYIPISTGGPGSVSHANDAGFFEIPPPVGANITGQIFDDLNQNGLQDSDEPYISEIIVTLFNADGTVVATTETDDNGSYIFQNILEGNYYVEVNLQTSVDGAVLDVEPTILDAGDDAIDSDFDPNTGQTNTFVFDPKEGDKDFDAGVFRPSGIINGIAFEDINGDGIQDANEPAIGGVTVTLLDCNDVVIATVITDASGNYSFGDLDKGDYKIRFDPSGNDSGVDNYIASPKGAGTDTTKDSDIDASFTSDCVSVFLDPIGIDGGFVIPKTTILGTAFEDINADGIQADTDLPIAGITVILSDCEGNEVARTLTDDLGNYVFDNLIFGDYQVRFDQTGNNNGIDYYEASPKDAGGDDSKDSDVDAQFLSDCVSLMEESIAIDAGFNEPTANVSGTAFEDIDGDGIRDVDEGLIINLLVSLVDCDGNVVATTITDEFGNYSFVDIRAGDYKIVFGTPSDINGNEFSATKQDVGNDDSIDSNIGVDNSTECIPLAPNSDNNISAGFIPPSGIISGLAFNDENQDGIQDAGELGIAGITVELQDCNGITIASTTTDNEGNYSFTGNLSDDYIIVFNVTTNTEGITDYTTSPKGTGGDDSTDSDIDIITNASDCVSFDPSKGLEIDAGFFRPTGILTGVVFNDLNQDGIQDTNEPFFGGVTVALQDCNGLTIATTTSNSDGSYSFDEVLLGDYQVVFNPTTNTEGIDGLVTSPQGNDSDIDPTTNASDCITFDPEKGLGIDAGFYEPVGSITGISFEDLNGDGIQDANETGIGGITIELQDCNGVVVATTTSNPDGSYSFDDIVQGNYQVYFNPNTNSQGIPNFDTSPEGGDSDIDSMTNTSDCVDFEPTQGSEINAGFTQPTGVVMGTVFNDIDGDGMQEPGEGAIEGVTVSLLDCDGTVLATTTTNENGNYYFEGRILGSYQVVFDANTNTDNILDYQTSPENRGDDTMDSDIDAVTNTSDCFQFDPTNGADIDAGFVQPKGELMGTIFNDIDADGMQEPGEGGISGVTVVLLDTEGTTIGTTTTDANGNYFFTDIISGAYQVLIDPATNSAGIDDYMNSPANQGDEDMDSDINPSTNRSDIFTFVALDGGDIDGGLFQPAEPVVIGNMVFKDCNKNGILDAGETGQGGIVVMLSGITLLGDDVNQQTTSNQDGTYQFNIDRPGTYQIMFVIPDDLTGVEFSPQNIGDNDMIDSDANPSTGIVAAFEVESGAVVSHVDVGVIDLVAPLIFNVPPDVTVSCNNPPDRPTSVKAVDNCDPNVDVAFDERIEETLCGASIIRTWTAEDECGNITRKQQTITVTDEEAPVITLSNPLLAGIPNGGSITFDCDAMPEFDENDIIATDNCDTDLTIEFVDLVRKEGNCQVDGYLTEMTCGWRAIDNCGNEMEYIITITVVDTRAPMLNNVPTDITVNLSDGQAIPPVPTNIGATDNCDENIFIQFEQTQTEETACGYDLIRTWTAIDNCGNKETASQTLSLIRDCVCPDELSDGQMVVHAACDGSTGGMILFNLTADARYYEFDFVPNLGVPNALGNARTDLPTGTYNIVVTYKGAADCKETYNINIGTMETATISIADSQKASCGQADGYVSLSPASFQYTWSDGIVAAQRSDLAAGTYKINYTDDNGCLGSTEITVEEPENCICLNFKIEVLQNTSPTCSGGTDGNLIVVARGGRETIRYEWSNGSMGTTLSNITAGMYTVIATDANGCQAQEEIMVMAPESIMLTINQTNGGCGERGMIDLHAQGGTGPYTYSWNTGATSQDLLSVPSGSYTVTVTDANNCTATSNAMISNGGAIVIQLGKQLPTCSDNNDGIVFATITGGKAPYTYQWSNGSIAKNLMNIGQGDYSLVVTDIDGCQSAAQISVEAPAPINVLLTPQSYCSESIADVKATVTGGTAPYTYQWNFGATTAEVKNLTAGTYSVTVTDEAGCQSTEVITLDVPLAFIINPIVIAPSCANTVGSISLNAAGGMLPYTYTWSNGSTANSLEGIGTGTYSATVVDQRGCSLTFTETFSDIAPLDGSSSTINPSCAEGTDGQIMVEVTGGTQPYSYEWQTGATTKNLTGVGAGLYNMTVTDANGCQFIFTEGLLRTGPIRINAAQRTDALCESADGTLSIDVEGGAAPYTYRWNTGAASASLTNLVAGNYEVTVTDSKGCTANQLFVVSSDCTCPSPLYTQIMVNNAKCGNSNGSIMIMVDQIERYTFDWGAVGTIGAANNERRNLPAGEYNVRVTYAGQAACSEIIAVTVGNSVAEEATVVSNIPAACDQNNGQIEMAPATFVYQWTDGVLGYKRTNLAPGVYTVQILDENGCSSSQQISVTRTACNTSTNPTTDPTCLLTAALNVTSMPTCDDLSAAIEAIAIGGQSPYTYKWSLSTIGNIQHPRGLSTGDYTVTITDANNCTATAMIIVTAPECGAPNNPIIPMIPTAPIIANCEVAISLSTVNAKCADEPSGTAGVTIIDGKAPYTYLWSNGQTTSEVTGLLAGVHSVTVTDANECVGVATTTVTAPTALSFTHEIVGGDCDRVEVAFSGMGGTSVWKWICDGQEGAINETVLLAPGTYTCFIMDNQWCSSESQEIIIPAISQDNCSGNVVSVDGQFQFTKFEGQKQGEAVAALEWVTKDEVHQGSFLVEHSTDGSQFEVVGLAITAIGPTTIGGYNHLVSLPNFGSNYFRIKYVDVLGNTTTSDVIELFKRLPRTADKAIVYPNPIAEAYTIDFLRPIEEEKEMIITNNLGSIIDRIMIPAGTIKYSLDATEYKAGIYTLMVSNRGEKNTTIRFVKLEL